MRDLGGVAGHEWLDVAYDHRRFFPGAEGFARKRADGDARQHSAEQAAEESRTQERAGRGSGAYGAREVLEFRWERVERVPAAEERECDEGAAREEEEGFRDPDTETALAIGGAREELERGVVREVLTDEPREGEEVEEEKGGGKGAHGREYGERRASVRCGRFSSSPPTRIQEPGT